MKKTNAFTLVEITITIAVAAILMVGISRATQNEIAQFTKLRNYEIALNLAKKQMAIMNNAAYPAVATTNQNDAFYSDFTITQIVSNIATSGANTLNKIEVQVSTVKDGQLISLNTYRTNVVSFGNGN